MKKVLTIVFLIYVSVAHAQYATPETGVNWTFEDLVAYSEGVVTKNGNEYTVHQTITISGTDTLAVLSDITVKLNAGVQLVVDGKEAAFIINAPTQAVFTATNTSEKYDIIEVKANSIIDWNHALFEHGKGIKIEDSNNRISHSTIQNMGYTNNTSGAISGTGGTITIANCSFLNNERSAISSNANIGTTWIISDCYFYNNVLENSNRPQINIGPCLKGDATKIMGNQVIGIDKNMVGGIGCSSLVGEETTFIIENNEVKNNRYGVTMTGANISSIIKRNRFTDNNLEVDSNNGGSGINITSYDGVIYAVISENIIAGNLWGITALKYGSGEGPICNLGDLTEGEDYNIGHNKFSNNGNNGVLYDYYNNSPNIVMAQNNHWGVERQNEEMIETVIYHKADDPELGGVIFLPPYIRVYKPVQNMQATVISNQEGGVSLELTWERPDVAFFEEITYEVYCNDDLIETIDNLYYVKENIPSGIYTYCIRAMYDQRGSKLICMEKVIEHPYPPKNIEYEINRENCEITLSWEHSINSDEESYNVYKNGSLVSKETTAMYYTEIISDPYAEINWCLETISEYGNSVKRCIISQPCMDNAINKTDREAFVLYPNPALDWVTISGKNIKSIEVYNLFGQLIEQKNGDTKQINISGYPSGIYLFKIFAEDNNVAVKRMVVAK